MQHCCRCARTRTSAALFVQAQFDSNSRSGKRTCEPAQVPHDRLTTAQPQPMAFLTTSAHAARTEAIKGEETMFENLFSLRGRVALVTGGSRGLGKMIAAGLLCFVAGPRLLTPRAR